MHGAIHQIEQKASMAKYRPQKTDSGTARTAVRILKKIKIKLSMKNYINNNILRN